MTLPFISRGEYFILSVVLDIIKYIIIAYPLYKMYQKANLKNPSFAFIPVFGALKIYNLVNLSMWIYLVVILISMIPFVGNLFFIGFSLWLNYTLFDNFDVGTVGRIIGMFFSVLVMWYVVLADKKFIGALDFKFTE